MANINGDTKEIKMTMTDGRVHSFMVNGDRVYLNGTSNYWPLEKLDGAIEKAKSAGAKIEEIAL